MKKKSEKSLRIHCMLQNSLTTNALCLSYFVLFDYEEYNI